MFALQANNAVTEGADGMAPELSTSKHDSVAAATASGVDSAIAGAEAQGEPSWLQRMHKVISNCSGWLRSCDTVMTPASVCWLLGK